MTSPRTEGSTSCLDDNAVIELVEGLLDPAQIVASQDHLDACASCRRLVSEVVKREREQVPASGEGAAVGSTEGRAWLPRGTRIDRYVILEQIGVGASGAVYAAYDPELDRRIALKLRRASGELGAEVSDAHRARMVREAQAMARLSHPNVVAVHEVGVAGRDVFIAMELVAGTTLRGWLQERPRGWSEVREVFLAAGRGLASAHRAGLVHRDFKPDNVLIGRDGRVGVTDFGLASVGPTQQVLDLAAGTAVLAMTVTGMMMGTPAYMAPEQLRGDAATAASDQFGFCVALHEAIYGERPFRGATVDELAASIVSGYAPARASRLRVPVRVARLLRRGLAADPAARHPSMDALLAELARRAPRRRWWIAGALAALVPASLALMLPRAAETPREAPCSNGAAEIAALHSFDRQLAIELAFRRTGAPYAADAARTVDVVVGRYAGDWANAHDEACRATRVLGHQSEAMLDLRMRCLDSRHRQLAALTELFARADQAVVERAATAVHELRPVDDCADLAALAAPIAPPSDLDTATRLAALEVREAEVLAQYDAGKFREALPIAQTLAEDAGALGYRPFEARALLTLALLQRNDDAVTLAALTLDRVVRVADVARDDTIRARARIMQIVVLGLQLDRVPEALLAEGAAEAVVDRVGDSRLTAELTGARGRLRVRQGQVEEGLALLTQAVQANEAIAGADHPSVWALGGELGSLHERLGHYDEAQRVLERARASAERVVGPDHPLVANLLSDLANLANSRGQFAEARQLYERVLAIRTRALGPDHGSIAQTLRVLGNTQRGLGALDASLSYLRRALAIVERDQDHAPSELAACLMDLGNALGSSGDYDASLGYLRRALAIYRDIDARNVPPTLFAIGLGLHGLGKDAEAVHSLEAAIAGWEAFLGPDHPHIAYALHGLGQLYLERGRPALALAPLERAARIRAGDPTPWQADTASLLGSVLWAVGGDRKRAIELVRSATAFYATDPRYADERAKNKAWLDAHPAPQLTPR